jgi:hypothetical protein
MSILFIENLKVNSKSMRFLETSSPKYKSIMGTKNYRQKTSAYYFLHASYVLIAHPLDRKNTT